MLEFAREQWLWLFVLVAAFFVAWWFARRYIRRRVTYGRVWHRVAKKLLPPGWKRVLRTACTLLISSLMLSALVLYAAGLQRAAEDAPPPLLIIIVLDNSPSMRAVHDGRSRAELAHERAQQVVDALGDRDRALIAHYREGAPLLGPWLKRGDAVRATPSTDFTAPDLAAFAAAAKGLRPPPDLPLQPEPEKLVLWLGDEVPGFPDEGWAPAQFRRLEYLAPGRAEVFPAGFGGRLPVLVETFGAEAWNHAVTHTQFVPPSASDGHAGELNFTACKFRGPLLVLRTADVQIDGVSEASGVTDFTLPLRIERYEVQVAVPGPDPLPQDDAVRTRVNPRRVSRVTLCHPANEGEANPYVVAALESFLPGRRVEIVSVPGASVDTDLLVCDRVLPQKYTAGSLLCFGVLPAEFGLVGNALRADPNLQLRTEVPEGLGFELPDLSLLTAREAHPLADGHLLTPLVRHIEGGTLVAMRRGEPDVLYCGFIPHESTLLQDDYSGFLLLLRWTQAIQAGSVSPIPPFVPAGAEADFTLASASTLRVTLTERAPWLPAYGPREYTITTGADGRGKLGPFVIPGEYIVTDAGREIGRVTAIWTNVGEQALAYTPADSADLDALLRPQHKPDWRDHLPGALLWLALGLMVVEWMLWLAGITE